MKSSDLSRPQMPHHRAAHVEALRALHAVHDTTVVHGTAYVSKTVTIHDTVLPLTLDGVAALVSLLLAIFALASPTQRRSLFMLLPMRRLLDRGRCGAGDSARPAAALRA